MSSIFEKKGWKYSIFILRMIVGLTFLYSGISKSLDLANFRWALIELKIFGWTLASFISIVVIMAEILLSVLILLGLFKKFASIHLGILIIAFGWVSVFAIVQGNFENCNCLGKWINLSYGPPHIILLSVLLVFTIFIFMDRSNFWGLDKYLKKYAYKRD